MTIRERERERDIYLDILVPVRQFYLVLFLLHSIIFDPGNLDFKDLRGTPHWAIRPHLLVQIHVVL